VNTTSPLTALNKAIVDIRLHPGVLPPVSHVEYYDLLASSPLLGRLQANMTSSTKAEVYDFVVKGRRTEPQPQITCAENFIKFRCAFFEICERIDRQTDRDTRRNISHS